MADSPGLTASELAQLAEFDSPVTDHRVSGIRDSIFEKPREIRRCPVEIGAHRIDQDIEGGLPA